MEEVTSEAIRGGCPLAYESIRGSRSRCCQQTLDFHLPGLCSCHFSQALDGNMGTLQALDPVVMRHPELQIAWTEGRR